MNPLITHAAVNRCVLHLSSYRLCDSIVAELSFLPPFRKEFRCSDNNQQKNSKNTFGQEQELNVTFVSTCKLTAHRSLTSLPHERKISIFGGFGLVHFKSGPTCHTCVCMDDAIEDSCEMETFHF